MNNLADSLSPYLLQHKKNPVNWYPWCDEAFNRAKNQNRPIFLSIGYAACHWCHVMAHESFENNIIAQYLNDNFIAIKVDREERPDIDNIYMQAVTAMTQQGGWPLSVFLTPEGKPFYGGTYFPYPARYGQINFLDLLQRIIEVWKTDQQKLLVNINALERHLQQKITTESTSVTTWENLQTKIPDIISSIDFINGGLLGSPKFPQIPLWDWLFTLGVHGKQATLIDACYLTAKKLCHGGIFDHLGGGWMRYSTDEHWLVPHFEKMLYDNALIIDWLSKLHAYQPDPIFAERVTQTIDWLLSAMLLPEGVFSASLDADSEGEEGRYYVWSYAELQTILGALAEKFLTYYGGSAIGNWEGVNILHRNHQQSGLLTNAELEACQKKLLAIRQCRVKPGRDDKVLLDWNALMVTALIQASAAFCKPDWLELAENLFMALKQTLLVESKWLHCYRQGRSAHPAMLEDYANIINAALRLYAATGEATYLTDAKNWQQQVEEFFSDADNQLYFQISRQASALIANLQPIMDGAVPAGNGITAINLAIFYLLTGENTYQVRLQLLLVTLSRTLEAEQHHFFSNICQSIAWQSHGVKVQGDFVATKMADNLLGHIPPLSILVQDYTIKNFQCCNNRECFATVDDVQILRRSLICM